MKGSKLQLCSNWEFVLADSQDGYTQWTISFQYYSSQHKTMPLYRNCYHFVDICHQQQLHSSTLSGPANKTRHTKNLEKLTAGLCGNCLLLIKQVCAWRSMQRESHHQVAGGENSATAKVSERTNQTLNFSALRPNDVITQCSMTNGYRLLSTIASSS